MVMNDGESWWWWWSSTVFCKTSSWLLLVQPLPAKERCRSSQTPEDGSWMMIKMDCDGKLTTDECQSTIACTPVWSGSCDCFEVAEDRTNHFWQEACQQHYFSYLSSYHQNVIFSIAVISFMDTATSYHRYLDYKYMYSKSLIPWLQFLLFSLSSRIAALLSSLASSMLSFTSWKYLTLLYVIVVLHVLFIPIYLDKDDHIEQRCQADPCVDGEQSNKAKGSLDWIFGESVTYIWGLKVLLYIINDTHLLIAPGVLW